MRIESNANIPQLIGLGILLAGAFVYFWWLTRRSLTDMSPGRKRLALGIRLFIVTLLFLAIAQVRWVRRHDALSVVFLMDASRSVRDEQRAAEVKFVQQAIKAKRPEDTIGGVTFG